MGSLYDFPFMVDMAFISVCHGMSVSLAEDYYSPLCPLDIFPKFRTLEFGEELVTIDQQATDGWGKLD